MTDANSEPKPAAVEPDDPDPELRSLVRGALVAKDAESVDVLAGFQKKLRERSGGKFYADLWSTAREPPILTFLVTSALMLVVLLIVYAVLAPLRGASERVETTPAPIQVISPAR